MDKLYERFFTLLEITSVNFTRYLYADIAWQSRLIGIIGARGVGKTTLVLQYIKQQLDVKKALYISADDLYFGEHSLFDVADDFVKSGGENLFIDEIHKYLNWSQELKNMYDSFPELRIVFTGSSVLDILKGSADLSRRALIYPLHGLSFREYLVLNHGVQSNAYALPQILSNEVKIATIQHPLPLFKQYLKNGYYPFGTEEGFDIRLHQVIVQTLETDIPQYANLSIGTSRKLKQLLTIIAASAPFKPNFSKIAELIGVSRNSLDDYFLYMERAGLITQLRAGTNGIRALGKVDKTYLANTNIIYALAQSTADIGTMRETFLLNQMQVKNNVLSARDVDFEVGGIAIEVGGKSKQHKQIKGYPNAYIAKDDIEYGYGNTVPLWAFGFNY